MQPMKQLRALSAISAYFSAISRSSLVVPVGLASMSIDVAMPDGANCDDSISVQGGYRRVGRGVPKHDPLK